jgi:hypothetical protein
MASPPPLLALPHELRDSILSLVLPTRLKLVHSTPSDPSFFSTLGILLTSRQIRHESIEALYRLLPHTAIIFPRTSRVPFLGAPSYARLRSCIRHLVLQTSYIKGVAMPFALSPVSDHSTKKLLAHVMRTMPRLERVDVQVRWVPGEVGTLTLPGMDSLLLPGTKRAMVNEIRDVTMGEAGEEQGWEVDVVVVDPRRWRGEWSGEVRLSKVVE